MQPQPPVERLRRRLSPHPADPAGFADPAEPAAQDADEADGDPNSLLPHWLPEDAAEQGWLARLRADPGRAGAIALALVAALAVLVTVFTVIRDRPAPVVSAKLPPVEAAPAHPAADPGPAAPDQAVVVSVVGLVHRPGLATLAPGARVADALTAAGGALDGADTIGLNMARQVADGEQIVVGIASAPGQPAVLGSSVGAGSRTPEPAGARAADAPGPAAPKPPKPGAGSPVNLNTATVDQLDALPGVGPVTAAAIVAWRDAHGRFSSVEQLGEVDGIGPARLEKLRGLVRV